MRMRASSIGWDIELCRRVMAVRQKYCCSRKHDYVRYLGNLAVGSARLGWRRLFWMGRNFKHIGVQISIHYGPLRTDGWRRDQTTEKFFLTYVHLIISICDWRT